MSTNEHKDLWTTGLAEYALLRPNQEAGVIDYTIVHKKTRTALIIEDEDDAAEVVQKMLEAGVEVWDTLPPQTM